MSDAEQTHTHALILSMFMTEVCAISESWDKASNYFMDMVLIWNHEAVIHCLEFKLSIWSSN